MPSPTCAEKHLGRSGEHKSDSPQETRVWEVFDTNDGATAVSTVLASAPATVTTADGKVLRIGGVTFEQVTDSLMDVTVKYGSKEKTPPEPNEVRIRGSIGGGTQHVTQAKEHIQTYPDDANKPDFAGCIGVTPDGVDGVDVELKEFKFTVTKTFAAADYPDLGNLYLAATCTNEGEVTYTDTVTGLTITLQEGEAFLHGAEFGEGRADGSIEFTYSFSANPNVENQTIGEITGIDKKGWEYLWVYYGKKPGGTGVGKTMLQIPKFVNVERVYDDADLQTGIGL